MFDTINEKSKCPYGRNIQDACAAVLPILEILFKMPAPGPRRGSNQWLQDLLDHPNIITFKDMMEFDVLLLKYIKTTDKPKLYHGETTPTGIYPARGETGYLSPSKVLPSTRRSMAYHPNFQYLRAGAVIWAIKKLRSLGLTPIRIKPETLPQHIMDQGYDNYVKVINTFHACYCHAQGLSRTSDMARLVLLYLHFGKGVFKQKPSKIILIIRKKV